MSILFGIKAFIVAMTGIFSVLFVTDYAKNKESDVTKKQMAGNYVIGFVTNFFDALGIGSFAPTMAAFKLAKLVPDKLIPGTLNVGDCIPVALEAFIFIVVIGVDSITLVSMLAAGILGAVVGVGVVNKLPERLIQTTMAVGLASAALLMLAGKVGIFPAGGEALGLTGIKLVIAICCNFILGLLLPLGIGNYAPCMAIVYLLGMNPAVAFPIMMGSGCLVLCTSGMRFTRGDMYHRKASMALTIGGIPGVIIATYIVKTMPLSVLQWLVIIVVTYTSVNLFVTAFKKQNAQAAA